MSKSKFKDVFKDKEQEWDQIATVLDIHTNWYQIDLFLI
ncbi:MAG: hypothetical protein ACI9QD_000102 [Thermoproteota archaeon]|jgi:hypothetical protein